MKYVSNREKAETAIGLKIKRQLLGIAVEYEGILDDQFREPKSGRVYGAEQEVSFDATGGGEKEVKYFVTSDGGRARFGTKVSFTANRGQEAKKRTVKFIVNRGKKLGGKGKKGQGVHQASAPGEAPAIDTAALRKGISHRIEQLSRMEFSLHVGVTAQSGRGTAQGASGRSIAHMLEFGTSRMEARPAWRPALQILQQRLRMNRQRRDYTSWWEGAVPASE